MKSIELKILFQLNNWIAGFEIIPRTLAVADYVLSSEICIGESREDQRRGEARQREEGRDIEYPTLRTLSPFLAFISF
jgi:ERCC4-type nuclease